jgi:topoisomerase-4 subunit A
MPEIEIEDVKHLMKDHYLKYASYVILERAIPDVVDGLKPVQRRILETLFKMHDGKLHKVANVSGQTMALHPHGEAAINEALVNLANKGYLLDQQGNFGNVLTGDPAAAPRYIETRLSHLAVKTVFNRDLTPYLPSYDGRYLEPVALPVKIPLLLLQGADGIAVGMSTHIFPHNFCELLEAEIAILEGREFYIVPDFVTGGIMDASQYDKGRGKLKLRARVEIRDAKTLVITEICHGTTTESLIRSIDEAAKKGKIKIESINDYTTEKVEIEIKLPRGQYAQELIDALYAYTECEVTLHPQCLVIKDEVPWETSVDEMLQFHVEKLQGYLKTELEIEHGRLSEKIFEKTLEQIFIENRLYKKIEELTSYEKIHATIEESLELFHHLLTRIPTLEDRERLLAIPIRRISRFDIEKNQREIQEIQDHLAKIEKDLKNIKKFTIQYIRQLLKEYGGNYPRRTEIQEIEEVDKRAIQTHAVKVGFDLATGFVGTKVAENVFECTNFDKILLLFKDGTYSVINIPEKQYVLHDGKKLVYVGVADKKTIMRVVYKDSKTLYCYCKRFVVTQFILDKVYNYLDKGTSLEYLTVEPNISVELQFVPKLKQKVSKTIFALDDVLVKGVSAKGVRMANREVKRVVMPQKSLPQPDLFEKR